MEQGPGHCATYTLSPRAARSDSGTVGTILSEGKNGKLKAVKEPAQSYTTAQGLQVFPVLKYTTDFLTPAFSVFLKLALSSEARLFNITKAPFGLKLLSPPVSLFSHSLWDFGVWGQISDISHECT